MNSREIADLLVAGLCLERPPVGLAPIQNPPDGGRGVAEAAPSGCTFWKRAEEGVFYASAADHPECPIGALTMGFSPDEDVQTRAKETLGLFVELEYFSMDEVAHLPSVTRPHMGIVYGPLADLPMAPEVVLVVVPPYQAMLLAESGESVALSEVPQLVAMGRPACAAIPRALESGQTTMSLGCIGARTYADIPEDRALVAIPAGRLPRTALHLQTLLHANETLGAVHREKKAQFAVAGAR